MKKGEEPFSGSFPLVFLPPAKQLQQTASSLNSLPVSLLSASALALSLLALPLLALSALFFRFLTALLFHRIVLHGVPPSKGQNLRLGSDSTASDANRPSVKYLCPHVLRRRRNTLLWLLAFFQLGRRRNTARPRTWPATRKPAHGQRGLNSGDEPGGIIFVHHSVKTGALRLRFETA